MKRTNARLGLASLFVLGFLLCFAPTPSDAYVRIRTPGGKLAKWPNLPVSWRYNHNGFNQLGAQQVATLMQGSFQKWEAPSCTNFRATYAGTTTAQLNGNDRVNVLIWNRGIPDPQFSNALALTIPQYLTNGDIVDMDIVFNSSYSWSVNPTGQQFDVHGTTTHEIGHLLGLNHSQDQTASMFATANPGVCPCRTLKNDDIQGVCAIYPSGASGGKRKVGESCDNQNLCDTGLTCVATQQGSATGLCLEVCTTSCPNGETCTPLQGGPSVCACQNDSQCSGSKTCTNFRCSRGNTNPTGTRGQPCTSQTGCASGFTCLLRQAGDTNGYCYQVCGNGQSCTGGEQCKTIPNASSACVCENNQECPSGSKCVNFICEKTTTPPKGGEEGKPCGAGGACQTGLQCVGDKNDPKNNLCVRPCQSDNDCSLGGTHCDSQYKVCLPKPTQGLGETCTADKLCKKGLFCIVLQQGSQSGVCLTTCTQAQNCSNGETCNPISGSNVSVCACSQAAQCTGGKTCKNARCQGSPPPPGCTNNSQCGANQICQNGKCVQRPTSGCTNNAQCKPDQLCQNGKCVPKPTGGCTNDTQCGVGQVCQNGRCIAGNPGGCNNNADCGSNQTCQAGACVPKNPGACTQNTDCGTNQVCQNGTCQTNPNACVPACGAGFFCANNRCVARAQCNDDGDCASGQTCDNGTCKESQDPQDPGQVQGSGCNCNTTSPEGSDPIFWLLVLLVGFLPLRRRVPASSKREVNHPSKRVP